MVEVEGRRPVEQGFEQKVLPGEVIFSRQLTLRELLHIKPTEENEAKYLPNDVPFGLQIDAHHSTNISLWKFSFSETQPVGLGELFPLLQAAKSGGSSREGQDLGGILADWGIILPEVREKEPQARELYDFHKEHVPEFSEFETNHFELFWKVLESGNRRRQEARFFNHQFHQFIDEREFFAKYGRGRDFSDKQELQSLVIAYSEYFKPFLEEKGFNIQPNSNPKDHDPFLNTRKLFYSMNEQEQRALAIEFYKKSVNKGGIEAERRFGRHLRWLEGEGNPGITTLIGKDSELNRIDYTGSLKPLDVDIREKGPLYEEPDSFRRLDNGQIELRRGESFVRMSIIEVEDGYKKVKLEDHRLSTAETMVPHIVWQTDKQTGKRSYYCGKLDQLPKHDTLLGQLVVAVYSQKVRDQMPREIKMKGINGEDKTQPMLEASAVLLVPRYSDQFLTQSPVILGLEALRTD